MKFISPQEVERVLEVADYHELIGRLQAFTLKFRGEFESIANREIK